MVVLAFERVRQVSLELIRPFDDGGVRVVVHRRLLDVSRVDEPQQRPPQCGHLLGGHCGMERLLHRTYLKLLIFFC